jgi:hypothetical protein
VEQRWEQGSGAKIGYAFELTATPPAPAAPVSMVGAKAIDLNGSRCSMQNPIPNFPVRRIFMFDPVTAVRTRMMFRHGMRTLRMSGWSLLMGLVTVSPASAEQRFDDVAGSWSGVGSMKPSDGPRERVRCKVDYTVGNEGQSVKMDVRCASDAYKMELRANIDQSGSALSGNWFESQYRQGGKISGLNINGLIEAKIEGDTITALLTVRTKGNRQSFSMESPGAWVSQVSIDLQRDSR